ncbi:SET domain-containing protein 4-like [Argiope bruennichi]|uniref:SET domain-containing protein 4 n=1 Tax=Argiope bruennichi TaxID=94029 RepID=A0A8T0ESG9_ARGBR|nr:SET domain-containing protein 4-like [Argiope bruennichi]KAF8778810.1 SET domain-containing protein 4 [Argiope bruennichi]
MAKLLGRTFRARRKKKHDIATTSENDNSATQKFNSLCKWMAENGYKSKKKLRPKNFPDTGRGLMTEEKICSGDIIISIPQNLLITSELVLKSELGEFFKLYCPNASGHQILSVFLMFERAKGKASIWYHYIESVPMSYNIPAFYGPQCLSVVPPLIYEQTLQQIKTVKDSYDQLNLILNHLEHSFPFTHGQVNFDVFKWAWCTVNTRCVFIECFKNDCAGKSCLFHLALAPFLDLLNHNTDVQVQAGFNQDSKHYEIISLCDFKKYSQVFINYGSHDNRMLLLEYGFVVPYNYNDNIPFTMDDIIAAYKNCQFSSHSLNTKLQFILQNNLNKSLMCSCDGLSWNLKIILKILTTDCQVKMSPDNHQRSPGLY